MSAEAMRETMHSYAETLLARGDYRRVFADGIRLKVSAPISEHRGANAAERAIRSLHQVAFDARPEIANLVVDEHGAAAEATFVGTHIGKFAGISATGNAVTLSALARGVPRRLDSASPPALSLAHCESDGVRASRLRSRDCESAGPRPLFRRDLTPTDAVPMHPGRSVEPRGASAGRPERSRSGNASGEPAQRGRARE
jgi:hypothetical protein